MEVLLSENKERTALFPILYPKVWEFYKRHEASFWTAEEVDFYNDIDCWEKLNSEERHFLIYMLSYISSSDGIIIKNPLIDIMNEVQLPEAKCYYRFQIMMESIHAEVFQVAIDTYLKNPNDKIQIFEVANSTKSIAQKNNWILNCGDKESLAEKLIAHAAILAIFYSSSICLIYYMKQKRLFPGLCFLNELFSRDKQLDVDFACLLYSMIEQKLPKKTIYEIIAEAVDLEQNFIIDLIPNSANGMNQKLLSQYTEFVADQLLISLGQTPLYKSKNPFGFMEALSIRTKIHYFTEKLSEFKSKTVDFGKSEVFISLPQEEIDLFTIENITNACGEFMEALGFELEVKEEPIYGSFFQRLKFVFRKRTTEVELNDAYEKGKLALEAKFLNLPTAEASEKIVNSTSNLITAIKDVDECVLRLGAIMLVKIQKDGKAIIVAETVSPKLISVLDENPNILKNPNLVYDLLQSEKAPIKELGEGEGTALTV